MMNAADDNAGRAGCHVRQPAGHRAFIPAPLPPDPPVDFDGPLRESMSEADHALGRLDGAVLTLSNPDLFVFMYVRKEAVLSSQIEGTQSSLQNLLAADPPAMAQFRRDGEQDSRESRGDWASEYAGYLQQSGAARRPGFQGAAMS